MKHLSQRESKSGVPICTFSGKEDNIAPCEEVMGWSQYTYGAFNSFELEGRPFLFEGAPAFFMGANRSTDVSIKI